MGPSALHQLDRLQSMLEALPESPGVLRLHCEIPGYPAFFPGGRGFKGQAFPTSPVMLLGHNYDSEAGFRKSLARGAEDPNIKTWKNLRESVLPAAGLSEEECFFTNFYLGAMQSTTNIGQFKCSAEYRAKCVDALRLQVEIVQPRVIALLGAWVPPAFAMAFPDFARHVGRNLRETQMRQPESGHRLQLADGRRVRVVCLVHPSNPRSLESHRAQGALLGSAVRAATAAESVFAP